MPWRGPEVPGEFPTLGPEVAAWIEAHCVVPDGDLVGQPLTLTDEMVRFLCWHYRIDPDAERFAYRRSQLVRPQKWGKGPFSAAMICAEAEGPVLFAGWDAAGEPVGRPWTTPWIQVTAVSEDQTDNVWRALQPMIELGELAGDIADTGLTRINLPGGGLIEPVTASAKSRLGQRITFAVQDETHSWLSVNGGWRLADNQRRNLAGMGGRSIETTNAWDPAEMSVAQRTAEAAAGDVFRDHRLGADGLSVRNRRERRKLLKAVYGDSWWVDIDRIDAEVAELLEHDAAQAERFFCNRIVATVDSWMDPQRWAAAAAPREVPNGTAIVLGFDGSRYDDWTVIRAETVEDGYQFTPTFGSGKPTIWDPSAHGGEVPEPEVDVAVAELHRRYRVVRMHCDPPGWQSAIDRWAAEHGDHVKRWETKRSTAMAAALERLHTDVHAGEGFAHDGCPTTAQHVGNAKREQTRGGVTIRKDRKNSPRKIDAAVTAAITHEARADALAAGLRPRRRRAMSF